jgi:predicted AlkP superfamily pyrophosphatase or phosphodiesterase
MRILLFAALVLQISGSSVFAQAKNNNPPKLVVGIVVDQLRAELLCRYWPRFGDNGFRKLINGGYYFRNAHFNYIPTYTGPGHASVYTGTTPRHHGIIANDWFNRDDKQMHYCAHDGAMTTVGSETEAGKMSARKLLSTTITDELKLATVKRGKVFAVALKDRSAVLPGGHMANGAFWFDEAKGIFISSSVYMKELPSWLKAYNESKAVNNHLSKGWQTLYPIETYTASLEDDTPYENTPFKKDKPVFPYDFSEFLKEGKLSVIRSTPFGNTITREVAVECIRKEGLGKDQDPDMICISFSSTDIIGHTFGPRSVEMEDTYLRLDKEIEEILNVLDKEVGKQNYTVFLTADHGAADVPNQLINEKIPGGYVYDTSIAKDLRSFCNTWYHDTSLVLNVSNEQVFLNHKRMYEMNIDRQQLERQMCELLVGTQGIAGAYPSNTLKYEQGAQNNSQLQLLQNGYNFKLSGDVAYIYEPGYLDYSQKGTSHGSGYVYDTHVPVIFYGAGIPQGEDYSYTTITQIAPTISELLRIGRPSACTGQPLNVLFKSK